ncbi:MAG TPA: phosphoenolpyruvate--protein phosphotransferase [Streptosporangiaceae bacterium]|nr:phosphoenolpyruvate--protein phosphotransferase [Streptosporangiaceae bacterium]
MSTDLRGLGVSAGSATGPAARLGTPPTLPPAEYTVSDTEAEAHRAVAALEAVGEFFQGRAADVGGQAADVLVAEAMMAGDPALVAQVRDMVRDGRPAPWAVSEALASYRAMLQSAGGYLAERAADLDDITNRAVALLLGEPMPGVPSPGHPFVLLADDLAPADTATLDPAIVIAIVTEGGGPTSHTAILAKTLGIPAIVSCAGALSVVDGTVVAVDGSTGQVLVDPTSAEIERSARRSAERAARLAVTRGPGRTKDGHPVKLLANVGGPADVPGILAANADGIGLLRTEFLFLGRRDAPTGDEQRATYTEILARLQGHKVVVRTLDAGADKPLAFATQHAEPNPALGVRGLRLDGLLPDLFDTQLEALARAAKDTGADVWVMAPMVSIPSEAAAFADRVRGHGLPTAGVMIEVPAAALCAEQIIAQVDFVSIGTNDLSQYTFAADRQAGALAPLLDPWQPALLQLIAMTAAAGRAAGKPVSVCGEAASDPLLAVVLTGLAVTSLSMASPSIADVRLALADRTLAECQAAARAALAASTPAAARAAASL